jgi:hypothetical protein
VYPLIVAIELVGKHVPAAKCTRNNRRSAERVVVYKVRVISKDSLGLCIPLSLLGFMSVNIVPRQRLPAGGVVFYAVRLVSKECRGLVLPRTSCLLFNFDFR